MAAEQTRRWLRRFAAVGALLLAAPLAIDRAAADNFTVESLMADLARNTGGRARFVERREMSLLNAPIVSSGELEFIPPNRLVKRTLKPKPESMVVDGDYLLFERGDKRYELSLAATPEAAAFVDSIRGTLSGDLPTLERVYRVRIEGTRDRWSLILFPKLARMQAIVVEIRVEGGGRQVKRIIIEQADGDRSTMQITPVTP